MIVKSIFVAVLLVIVIGMLACGKSVTDPQANSSGAETANAQPLPSPSKARIDETKDPAPQLRRSIANVSFRPDEAKPFSALGDEDWHKLPPYSEITTDDAGEGELRIAGCMLVHIFRQSGLTTAPCSKERYMSGSIICALAGVITFNKWCNDKVIIETSSARMELEGTWVAVTHSPKERVTVTIVLEGKARIWAMENKEVIGEPVNVEKGQFWFNGPGKEPGNVSGVSARQPQSLKQLPAVTKALQISDAVKIIENRAKKEKIPFVGS